MPPKLQADRLSKLEQNLLRALQLLLETQRKHQCPTCSLRGLLRQLIRESGRMPYGGWPINRRDKVSAKEA